MEFGGNTFIIFQAYHFLKGANGSVIWSGRSDSKSDLISLVI